MISYNTELAKKFIHFFPAATYRQTWMNFLANLILPIMQIPLWQVILQVSSYFMLTEMNWELCPWKDIFEEESIKLVDSEVQERVSRKEANWKGETEVAPEKKSIFLKKYFLFIVYFWLCWVLVAAQAFLWLQGTGASHLVASPVAGHRRKGAWACLGSVAVSHGLCCSMASDIFPDQGSNPCPLHWQVKHFYHRATREAFKIPILQFAVRLYFLERLMSSCQDVSEQGSFS